MATAFCGTLMEYEQVWRYIVRLRELLGVSQDRMAEMTGISRTAWQNVEYQKTKDPGTSVLIDAVHGLNASFDDVRELSSRDASVQDALSRAQRRYEEIIAGGTTTRADSVSTRDLIADIRRLEDELTRTAVVFPILSEILSRFRAVSGE